MKLQTIIHATENTKPVVERLVNENLDKKLNTYLKQFEKEDAKWHKKWKQITWGFCIGSVVFTIGGIFAMWGVSLLFRK